VDVVLLSVKTELQVTGQVLSRCFLYYFMYFAGYDENSELM